MIPKAHHLREKISKLNFNKTKLWFFSSKELLEKEMTQRGRKYLQNMYLKKTCIQYILTAQ